MMKTKSQPVKSITSCLTIHDEQLISHDIMIIIDYSEIKRRRKLNPSDNE